VGGHLTRGDRPSYEDHVLAREGQQGEGGRRVDEAGYLLTPHEKDRGSLVRGGGQGGVVQDETGSDDQYDISGSAAIGEGRKEGREGGSYAIVVGVCSHVSMILK
jgi:hypothetical protein